MLFAGPGWVVTGCAKLAAGSFLTYLAVERGIGNNPEPELHGGHELLDRAGGPVATSHRCAGARSGSARGRHFGVAA